MFTIKYIFIIFNKAVYANITSNKTESIISFYIDMASCKENLLFYLQNSRILLFVKILSQVFVMIVMFHQLDLWRYLNCAAWL